MHWPRARHAELHCGGRQSDQRMPMCWHQDGADIADLHRESQAGRHHRRPGQKRRNSLSGRCPGDDHLVRQAARVFRGRQDAGAAQPPRPGGGAIHLGFRRRAQRRRPEPSEPRRQCRADRFARRFQPGRHSVQRASGVPLVWPDRRHAVADDDWHEAVSLPLAAALPGDSRTRLYHQCHDIVWHRHVFQRLCPYGQSL